MLYGWGKAAYDRINRHEEECGKRWDYARQEARDTRTALAKEIHDAVSLQTMMIERVTTNQNRLFLGVAGAVISILLSVLGMLLHKDGAL